MTSGYQAVIDACVLVNAALRDTLLRLAEPPHLFLPRWSNDIMAETKRTMEDRLGCTAEQTEHLASELRLHFEDAWVDGYEPLIAAMGNHPKDRHVLAAAVKTGAQTIVTFNLKDFQKEALAPWDVQAQSPDAFLIDQYHLDPKLVVAKLRQQASLHADGLGRLLAIHKRSLPGFVDVIRTHITAELVDKMLAHQQGKI
jgi:predicted nucleic acid-binding protein